MDSIADVTADSPGRRGRAIQHAPGRRLKLTFPVPASAAEMTTYRDPAWKLPVIVLFHPGGYGVAGVDEYGTLLDFSEDEMRAAINP